MGGETRQYQIQFDPVKLLASKLTVSDLIAAARNATGTRGAGFVDTPNQRVVLQSMGQAVTPEQLGDAVVSTANGTSLTLKDVATIAVGAEPKFGDALIMGRQGVLVKLLSLYGSNTMEVTRAVEAAWPTCSRCSRPGHHCLPAQHRPATFIENALYHMKRSLLIGAVLVVVCCSCSCSTCEPRSSITAIPLSLLVAIIILDAFGRR